MKQRGLGQTGRRGFTPYHAGSLAHPVRARSNGTRRLGRGTGFTLVEMLLVFTVMVVILAGVLTSFMVGQTSFLSADASTLIQQQARQAFDNMVRELREAGAAAGDQVSVTNNTNQLNFQIVTGYNVPGECPNAVCWGSGEPGGNGEWVHYAVVGDALNARGQLVRCTNANELGAIGAFGPGCRVLANNVLLPNAVGPPTFANNGNIITIRFEFQVNNPRLPNRSQTTGVLTSSVRMRNPAS